MSHMCVKRQRLSCKTKGATLVIAICLMFIITATTLSPIRGVPFRWNVSCSTAGSWQVGRTLTDQTVPKLTCSDDSVVQLTGQTILHPTLPIRFC